MVCSRGSVADYMRIKEMAMLLIRIHLYTYKMGNVYCCVQVEEQMVGFTKRFADISSPRSCHSNGKFACEMQNKNQVIGAMVAVQNMDEVSGQRDAIAQAIMKEMEKPVGLNGYEILQVQIWDVKLDEGLERAVIEAKNAMRKVEGEAEYKKLSVARHSQAIVDVAWDISGKISGVTGKDYFDLALMSQYIDSMSDRGGKSKSSMLFIPQGPGAMREVTAKIHDGLLEASMSQC
ncbi:hypersensitive-induced reaction 1 protein-like [Syzygium oleosum]|uniref:hypersensitive-induced reaction 1 protein-like n=1 Tax=Syzygium oleosum TaxID=219896 RepID=UPI0024BB6EE3|nr:hypersensitive-induced reaction 1 protein-like [Syzygium oleosum]